MLPSGVSPKNHMCYRCLVHSFIHSSIDHIKLLNDRVLLLKYMIRLDILVSLRKPKETGQGDHGPRVGRQIPTG